MSKLGLLAIVAAIALAACAGTSVNGAGANMNWSFGKLYNSLTAETGVKTETAAFGSLDRQKLDIYTANTDDGSGPVAIFYYGGGWTDGDRATYKFVGTALATRGITTIVPDYRLYPEVSFPTFMEDAALAYAWVAKRFKNSRGETRPIVVIGHSAGAYIATMLALNRSYLDKIEKGIPQPAAMIGLAGPYSFDPTTWPTTKDIFAPAKGNRDQARVVTFARPNAPPAFLAHGETDETVKMYNMHDLDKALSNNGNVVRSIEYPGIAHIGIVLAISSPFRWRAPVLNDIIGFIERYGANAK